MATFTLTSVKGKTFVSSPIRTIGTIVIFLKRKYCVIISSGNHICQNLTFDCHFFAHVRHRDKSRKALKSGYCLVISDLKYI